MESIFTGWLLLWAINAGIGVVYIARWYWWRVNAWSEISAIACLIGVIAIILLVDSIALMKAILVSIVVLTFVAIVIWGLSKKEWRKQYMGSSIFILSMIVLSIALIVSITLPEKTYPWTLIYTLPISLAIWLSATMLTKPTDENKLIEFYKRTHPGGPGWNKIAVKIEKDYSAGHIFTRRNIVGCIFGIIGTYAALIGFGHLMFGNLVSGSILIALLIVSIYIIVKNLSNETWETVT
jgi:hypothetical protein